MASYTVTELLYKMTGDSSQLLRENEKASKSSQKMGDSLSAQYRRIEVAASVFGEETKVLARKQEVLREKIQMLIDKGVDPANKGFQKLTREYNENKNKLAQVETKTSIFKSSLAKLGAAAVAAFSVSAVISFGKEIVKLASDAEETRTKFIAVFGGVQEEANKAAEALSKDFGLALSTSKDMLSATGNLLQAFGLTEEASLSLSDQVQRIASDLVSFTNYSGTAKDASDAITKAILGETEAAKSLGLSLGEEMLRDFAAQHGKALNTLSREERSLLLVKMAAQQSGKAIGDAANTWGSYAATSRRLSESWKQFQENLGSAIIPALTVVLNILTEVLKGYNDLFSLAKKYSGITKNTVAEDIKNKEQIIATYTRLKENEIARGKSILVSEASYQKLLKSYDDNIAKAEEELKVLKEKDKLANKPAPKPKSKSESGDGGSKPKDLKDETAAVEDLTNAYSVFGNELEKTREFRSYVDNITGSFLNLYDAIAAVNSEGSDIEKLAGATKIYNAASAETIGILGAISEYQQASYQQRINQIESQLQAELEAAGVSEETAVEKAQTELDAAIASGDEEAIADAKKELTKAQIEEKYAKRKAKLEYEMNLQAWKMQRIMAVAQGAQAVLNAYSSAAAIPVIGFVLAPIAAAAAAVVAGLQLATINKAKPTPPALATGGLVPGSADGSIVRISENNRTEAVLNQDQMANFLDLANGKGSSGGMSIAQLPAMSEDALYSQLFKASKDGRLYIASRSVQSK